MKRLFKILGTLGLLFLLLFSLPLSGWAGQSLKVQKQSFVEEELLLRFKEGISESEIEKVEQKFGIQTLRKLKGRIRKVKIPKGKSVEEMVEKLSHNPQVEFAEPNFIAEALFVPDDPSYSYQWHLKQVNLEPAWEVSQGEGVIVAVLDTGIAYEDFRGERWWERYKKAPDFSETQFTQGYDFVNEDIHPNDDHGHGTFVAGTIAQSTNNNLGVAGVAPKAILMPVKVLDEYGRGSYSDIAEGLRWAVDKGAQVINLSLGGRFDSQTLKEAVFYAYNSEVTVVAAAGNDGKVGEDAVLYPAAYDDYVIAVGAVRFDKKRTWYSNGGESLDLVAPGGDLEVDQNGDGFGDGILQQTFRDRRHLDDFHYYFYQGTSFAAPHVSGVAAMIIEQGTSDPLSVRQILQNTAEDLGSPGRDDEYGWGLLDAAFALGLEVPPSPPVEEKVLEVKAQTLGKDGEPQSIFFLRERVYIFVQVNFQEAPVKDTLVTATIKDPNGKIWKVLKDETDKNGEFLERTRLSRRSPIGVYTVEIEVEKEGFEKATTGLSFEVKKSP